MTCHAGVQFGPRQSARQLKPHWCWAACIQTIFATHGFSVPQQRIVEKIFGNLHDQSATAQEILSAIDGAWEGQNGKSFDAKGFVLWDRVAKFERPDAIAEAAKELENGNPLIFANDIHTMVLTAMTYSEDPDGRIFVESLTVRDPWPYIANRHSLPVDEIAKSGLLCGVHVDAA